MYQRKISTSASPRVEVTACQGNLAVTTWDNLEILIEVDSQDVLAVDEREDAVALAANGDCTLTVPTATFLVVVQVQGDHTLKGTIGSIDVATVQGDVRLRGGAGSVSLGTIQTDLTVGNWEGSVDAEAIQGDVTAQGTAGDVSLGTVGGDLMATEVGGSLMVQSVGGDLTIRDAVDTLKVQLVGSDARVRNATGDVSLGTVGGDLTAEEIGGDLNLGTVGGDAYLRQLHGSISLGNVGADLVGRHLLAGAEVVVVGGDVSLKTVFAGPYTYRVEARGKVDVKALPGSSATFTLQAAGEQVGVKGVAGEMVEDRWWRGVLGDGEAQVALTSTHGQVMLKALGVEEGQEFKDFSFAADFGDLGAEAGAAAEDLAWSIQQRVAEKLSKIDFEAIARREAERARRQAEREAARVRRVAEKARRKAERTQRKARRKGGQWHLEWDTERGSRRTSKVSQGASEEERLVILQMLAEGKISAKEAETLLQALES